MSSDLPQGWEEKELSELIDIQSGFAFKSKDFRSNGTPVIKIKNIVPPEIKLNEIQFVSQELALENKKYQVKYNDILISLTGSNVNKMSSAVGKIGRLRIRDKEFLLNQRVGKFVVKDDEELDYEFLYYLVSRYEVQYSLASSASGSANQANINPSTIKSLKFIFPTIEEQKRIADILSAFDDKIELNNQMNQTLEDMATELFKEWFENFNFPNSEGKAYKTNGGEMKASESGEIPIDWEIKYLKEISNIIMGQSPKGKSYNVENIGFPLINGASDFEGTLPKPKKYTTEPTKISEDNDIVFGIRATIGNVVFINKGYCLGRGVAAIRVEERLLEFVFLLLQKEIDNLAQLATGSVFANLTKNDLEKLKIVFPSNDTLIEFSKCINPIFEQIKLNHKENKTLKKQRDTLIPKLMSGEIRV